MLQSHGLKKDSGARCSNGIVEFQYVVISMFCSIGKQVELLAEILECFSSVGKGLVETFLMLSNLAVDRQCSGYCNTGIRFSTV